MFEEEPEGRRADSQSAARETVADDASAPMAPGVDDSTEVPDATSLLRRQELLEVWAEGAEPNERLSGFPHGEAIRRSFGEAVTADAFVDEALCARLGAEAFAAEDRVVFRSPSPSLHTAAHEATHLAQQRGHSTGGDVNDERHADAIADLVSGGVPAWQWLPSPAATSTVRVQLEPAKSSASPAPDPELTRFEKTLLHTHWTSPKQRQDHIRGAYEAWARRQGKKSDPDERDVWIAHYEDRWARANPAKWGAPPPMGAEDVIAATDDAAAAERRKNDPNAVRRADAVKRAAANGDPRGVLRAFREAESPGELLDIEANLDMDGIISGLDEWTAVQLGMLGPMKSGAAAMNRKRAAYISRQAANDPAAAEVFVMYMFQGMYTDDIRAVVEILAEDRQLRRSLGHMQAVQVELTKRGIRLDAKESKVEDELNENKIQGPGGYHDKPRGRIGGLLSGLGQGIEGIFRRPDSSMLSDRLDLPEQYRDVFDQVLDAETTEAFSPKNIILGGLDHMMLGMPGGLYNLVAGTAGGVRDLATGHYEEAGEELTAAAIVTLTFLGVKVSRLIRGAPKAPAVDPQTLKGPAGPGQFVIQGFSGPISREEARLGSILALSPEGQAAAGRLIARLGQGGLIKVSKHLQANSRAAILAYEYGEEGVVALYEAEGDVAKATAALKAGRRAAPAALPPASRAGATPEGAVEADPAGQSDARTSASGTNEVGSRSTQRAQPPGPSVAGGEKAETRPTSATRPELRSPAARHNLRSVRQNTYPRDRNTVVEPGVDVAGDVAAINRGEAIREGNNYVVNGRTYGSHDGTLYPISGPGFHQLNRGAFKALGVLNQFGDTPRARAILGSMKDVGSAEVEAALRAWRAGQ